MSVVQSLAGLLSLGGLFEIWTELDTWIVVTGILSSVSCALLGNFMVLRRLSMMGDAISHAVLPGLAIAFLVTGSRDSVTMFIGAAIVGVLTAVFTQSIHSLGKVDEGASMGVVFTTLFAIGLVLIVRAADSVDLDPGCVLYGAIELVPLEVVEVGSWLVPRAVVTLTVVLAINVGFIALFFKELRISAFDPATATTMGINAQVMHYLLMTLVAVTTVASFESVGSILVIAMLIVPAASAHLLTDRLLTMIIVSAVIAAVAAAGGHAAAITVPGIWGYADTSTAGMMAVVSGVIFFFTVFLAPRHGIVMKGVNQARLALRIVREDILALLYRLDETEGHESLPPVSRLLRECNGTGRLLYTMGMAALRMEGKVQRHGNVYHLTDIGTKKAGSLIRTHRLWESYLHKYSNLQVDHLHFSAERLEHVTGTRMQQALAAKTESPPTDPHGKAIPGDAEL